MENFFNPHFVYGGVFVPNYLLSASKISHGAKLLYRMLIERSDRQGETLTSISHLASLIADKELRVVEFLDELENARFIKVQWHPSDRKFFRCLFLRPAWIKKRGRQREAGRATKERELKRAPLSRHDEQVCREYALACQVEGQGIRKLEAFINYLHYSGAQDREIDEYLARQEREGGSNASDN